jgi:C1A family cysteine protease
MAKHVFNLVPSPVDERDKLYAPPFRLFAKPLPTSVDLSNTCSSIVDQGNLGSCTANALVSGVREAMLLKQQIPYTSLSRLFLYFQERQAEGTTSEDSGAYLKDGCDILLHTGVCKESTWPYIESKFKVVPPVTSGLEATSFRVLSYAKVTGVMGMKVALSNGNILASGMAVFSQMESKEAEKTGIVRVPAQGEQNLGGHAVCCVGYVDTPRGPSYWKGGGYFIMRNSWGLNWGLKGYFKIAYDYVNLGYLYESWSLA